MEHAAAALRVVRGVMHSSRRVGTVGVVVAMLMAVGGGTALGAPSSYTLPQWWGKYQALLKRTSPLSVTAPLSVSANVDASNEDGPQSETSITINPNDPSMVVGGSNEIF